MFKTILKQFWQNFVKKFRFTRLCREIVNVANYALYPESFCDENLAIRKVFAFSDSAVEITKSLEYVYFFKGVGRTTSDTAGGSLNSESVQKQENEKIPWLIKNLDSRGAPNNLRYSRGVTDFGKCLDTGK